MVKKTMFKNAIVAFVISAAMLIASAHTVSAQAGSTNQTLDDRFSIRFGLYYPSIDTSVKINDQTYDFEEVGE